MHTFEDVNDGNRQPRRGHQFLVPAVLAVAALGTALHPPQIHEFRIDSGAVLQPVALEHVMERRPQGPPPWGDVEQVTPEEVEEISGPTWETGGRPEAAGSNELRQRPES